MLITDYFDRTVIINLPHRRDRAAETRAEFKSVGWPIETDRVAFSSACRPTEAAGFPSIGGRGCFLSHRQVILQAKADGLKNLLVMEDDVAFLPQMGRYEQLAIEQLEKADWGFAYFGHVLALTASTTGGWQKVAADQSISQTHFYAVNRCVFDRFLAFLEVQEHLPPGHADGGPMHYDGLISTFRAQNRDVITLAFAPNLGYQRSSRTDLHELRFFDRLCLLRQLATGMRMLKNSLLRLWHRIKRR